MPDLVPVGRSRAPQAPGSVNNVVGDGCVHGNPFSRPAPGTGHVPHAKLTEPPRTVRARDMAQGATNGAGGVYGRMSSVIHMGLSEKKLPAALASGEYFGAVQDTILISAGVKAPSDSEGRAVRE
jgi:hypothetical protein